MTHKLTESDVEDATLAWLEQLGYTVGHAPDIAPGEPQAERERYDDVVLVGRLRRALSAINTHIPASSRATLIEEAIQKIVKLDTHDVVRSNQRFHQWLVEGMDVSYRNGTKTSANKLYLVDFASPDKNDWLALNQFTVTHINAKSQAKTERRPDVVIFVNGLPLVVIELKNAADEKADIENAFVQIQTYKVDSRNLFVYNEGIVISDGIQARFGALTAGYEWFKPWRTIDGTATHAESLEVLLKGIFERTVYLDLLKSFTVFEDNGVHVIKKVAGYHQFHAVNKAIQSTVTASSEKGDQRIGVVWHTQGSGKSLSMLFYAGKVIQHPAMNNPTIVVLTDRNDLDEQLFGTFAGGQGLLRQEPKQAIDRAHLKELLTVAAGGVVFTTIQKFHPDEAARYPTLSERRNIVFIADEAHRSQYGFDAKLRQRDGDMVKAYGFAKYVRDALPNASFIGFTGTPVDIVGANTQQVFGDYIDIYDIRDAIDDGATVPIYYQARVATLALHQEQVPQLDLEFDDITEDEEDTEKERLRTKWSALEALVGADERLERIAQDIVTHYEERTEALDGKAMVVCMSRRICVDLYTKIIALRPDWHGDQDTEGIVKVIMTGSASDPEYFQSHVRSKPRRKKLAERFKDASDSFKIVIVRDMWLTGFDAPPLHTMYIDKPMRGHSLMQAIARVNRVFRDKPGGLVVDYLGIATELRDAIHQYTVKGSEKPAEFIDQAIHVMLTNYDVVKNFYHQFDYQLFFSKDPTQRLGIIPRAVEHVLSQTNGKKRYIEAVTRLTKSYALVMPDKQALLIRDDVAFFQAVKAVIIKHTRTSGKLRNELDSAIKQLVSKSVTSTDLVDLFRSQGLQSPDISVMSDDFLQSVQNLPQKNLAVELLQRLLNDEIKARSKRNAVQARSFATLLEQAITKYENRSVESVVVIEELIQLAIQLRNANQRGDALNLNDDELAFYDALADNKSAIDVMGDAQLAVIARDLLESVRQNVTIDWTRKESARAKIRVLVKRILKKYGYPPDMTQVATETVLEQAELVATGQVSG